MPNSQATNPPIILASASPRRAALLTQAGHTFQTFPSPITEPTRRPADIPLELWPTALAFIKAYAVQKKLETQKRRNSKLETRNKKLETPIILGADTIVLFQNRPINKPRNRTHARQLLQRLSGQTHTVITGLALLRGPHIRLSRAVSTCQIKKLSPAALEKYLDTNLWQGKAGAYGIQDPLPKNTLSIKLLTGERSNVIGLPLKLLQHELDQLQSTP